MNDILSKEKSQTILSHHLGETVRVIQHEQVSASGLFRYLELYYRGYLLNLTFSRSRINREEGTEIYHVQAESMYQQSSYIIKVATTSIDQSRSYAPNAFSVEYDLLQLLSAGSIPLPLPLAIPRPIASSLTPSAQLPYPYIIFCRPLGTPLASFDNPRTAAQVGGFLRALHAIDTDYFGRPDTPPADRLLSWQDAFIMAFEEVLEDIASTTLPSADVERIRMALGRAIGAYLFDDVEAPSLVAFTASEPSSFLVGEEGNLVCALANGLPRAIWGDPLLERAFCNPPNALVDAYTRISGGELIVFERQRAKIAWYEMYAALLVLVGSARTGKNEGWDQAVQKDGKVKWAREEVDRRLKQLEDGSIL